MNNAEAIHILAPLIAVSGIAMSIAPLLQVRLIWQRRSSEGVSLGLPIIFLVGVFIWLAYGIALEDPAIIVPEVVGVICNSLSVFMVFFYRGRSSLMEEVIF
jgi:uncharacterized protein with PQ loop repeat